MKQYIETSRKGPFIKYINNGFASPLGGTEITLAHRRRAEFLCFTQHVQYALTAKLAFVSDYQGMPCGSSC